MEVQELFRMNFEDSFQFLRLDDGIVFDNGVVISDYHDQD